MKYDLIMANFSNNYTLCSWNDTIHLEVGLCNFTNDKSNKSSNQTSLPRELIFSTDSLVSVIAYSILFTIAAIGNLSVLITLWRRRYSRVNLFIIHLCLADLLVTFIMLPIEIGWHVTVSWKAGDIGCRILMFFRAFGLYSSSFILIVISIDRYLAVVHPLCIRNTRCRRKTMLGISWSLSAIASAPQHLLVLVLLGTDITTKSVIFHEETHPDHKWYRQCVTFNFFPSKSHELAYNLFSSTLLYLLPLIIIIICYSLILFEMSKRRTYETQNKKNISGRRTQLLKKNSSSLKKIQSARNRTLKMTVYIVLVFLACWTPYYVMSAWWWFDRDGAKEVDNKIQRGLFIFAVCSSCMNPIIYGMFTTAFQNEFNKFSSWISTRCQQRRHVQDRDIYYRRKEKMECYFR